MCGDRGVKLALVAFLKDLLHHVDNWMIERQIHLVVQWVVLPQFNPELSLGTCLVEISVFFPWLFLRGVLCVLQIPSITTCW